MLTHSRRSQAQRRCAFVARFVAQISEITGNALRCKAPRTERVGFEPAVRLPVQRFSSSMILVTPCIALVAKRALQFANFAVTVSACDL